MRTNIQIASEQQREVYDLCPKPLLSQLAVLHKISVREFAEIFGMSKSHAEEILNHKKIPSLELAVKIARYWEVTVDELFAWHFDDDGIRRPLIVEIDGYPVVLKASKREHGALEIVGALVKLMREKFGEKPDEPSDVHGVR